MASGINLADPDCEPSDEDLQQLSHRAFAHVVAENRASAEHLERSIEIRRRAVLERVRLLLASSPPVR